MQYGKHLVKGLHGKHEVRWLLYRYKLPLHVKQKKNYRYDISYMHIINGMILIGCICGLYINSVDNISLIELCYSIPPCKGW